MRRPNGHFRDFNPNSEHQWSQNPPSRTSSSLQGQSQSGGHANMRRALPAKIPELGESATRCTMPTCSDLLIGNLTRAGWQQGSMFEEVYFIPGEESVAA